MRLEGKIALVTGGTRGIGRATVEMFAAEGAAVLFTGRTEDAGREVEEAVAAASGQAVFHRADSGVEAEVAGAVAAAVARFGGLTTLVNNAVATDVIGKDTHIDEIDNETFDRTLRVALYGTFWGCKYAIPEMRKAGNGSIVNVSASSSKGAMSHRPAYHAAKGAINALTRQLAVDYGQDDIRANTIIVGFTPNGGPGMTAILADPEYRSAFERNIMVPRFGEPADIASGATYLASDESKYITGIELTIDGGGLAHQAVPAIDFARLASRR